MSDSTSKIFNVEEVTGKEHSALETTAAEARLEAPNAAVAQEIDANAEEEKEAAEQVAAYAKTIGTDLTGEPTTAVNPFKKGVDGEPKSAVNTFEKNASRTTNAAVAEGKHDVDEAKAVGAGYVEQAKAYANSALETAQSYIPATVAGKPVGETAANVASSIQSGAATAYTTVVGTAGPQVEKAVHAAQNYLNSSGTETDKAFPTEHLKTSSSTTTGASPNVPSIHN